MYDENAEDEVTITVIATGLDAHGANTPVERAMKDSQTTKTRYRLSRPRFRELLRP